MRIHGLLTILALLIIAAGFVPQYMGEIGSMTGEHTGVMLADELGTIGDDFNLSFKDGLVESTLIMEYYDGTEYVTVTDETAQQFYTYYLLNTDSSQKLYLDGSFDDGKFTDLSGNGNHGTSYNGATTGTGVVGDGMVFDGVDDRIIVFNSTELNGFSEFTVSLFANKNNVDSREYALYKDGVFYLMLTESNGAVYFRFWDSTGVIATFHGSTPSTVITDSVWHHIVITYNGTSVITYIDGVSVYSSDADAGKTFNTNLNNLIISGTGTSYIQDGTLDEIRIYNRALTGEESEVLYDVPLQMEAWDGYTLYASYEYMDTFSPIGTDIFTVGFPVLGIVILVFVGASYLYNN